MDAAKKRRYSGNKVYIPVILRLMYVGVFSETVGN